jgi:prophage maintenance system killer protein
MSNNKKKKVGLSIEEREKRQEKLWKLFDLILKSLEKEFKEGNPKPYFMDIAIRFLSINGVTLKKTQAQAEQVRDIKDALETLEIPFNEHRKKTPVIPLIPYNKKLDS